MDPLEGIGNDLRNLLTPMVLGADKYAHVLIGVGGTYFSLTKDQLAVAYTLGGLGLMAIGNHFNMETVTSIAPYMLVPGLLGIVKSAAASFIKGT